METRSFIVPAANIIMLEEHIAKLNKRAKKLGLEGITFIYSKAFLQMVSNSKGLPKEMLSIPVEITGPFSVQYDGWEFVASIQHLPTGENIIRSIVDNLVTPNKYKNSGSNCDHCNVNRYRKDTYLVRHTSGDFRKVGSTCIKDFLGGNSPDDILLRANFSAESLQFFSGITGVTSDHNDGLYYINTFLAHTAAIIRDYGFVSKAKAKESNLYSTADRVRDNLEMTINSVVSDKEKELASKAIGWVENLSDEVCNSSDYLHNIRAIVRSGMVGLKTMGFAASIIPVFKKENPVLKKISQHVGNVNDRLDFNITVKHLFTGTSTYGVYYKFIFADENENVLTWMTSKDPSLELNKNYKIRGTVKGHVEFKNVKQTELTRCEILN